MVMVTDNFRPVVAVVKGGPSNEFSFRPAIEDNDAFINARGRFPRITQSSVALCKILKEAFSFLPVHDADFHSLLSCVFQQFKPCVLLKACYSRHNCLLSVSDHRTR